MHVCFAGKRLSAERCIALKSSAIVIIILMFDFIVYACVLSCLLLASVVYNFLRLLSTIFDEKHVVFRFSVTRVYCDKMTKATIISLECIAMSLSV